MRYFDVNFDSNDMMCILTPSSTALHPPVIIYIPHIDVYTHMYCTIGLALLVSFHIYIYIIFMSYSSHS